MRSIWARALAGGAPSGAIATIEYGDRWTFTIDDPRSPFRATYPDDCIAAESP
jgi:hypothetical protein